MTFVEIRNTIIKLLADYLGIKVVLSDEAAPVEPFPFGYYTVTSPYIPTGEQGNYSEEDVPGGTTITTTRTEMPSATFSFVFCSINRWTNDDDGEDTEPFIFGEDEAQQLAERAQGFFLHVAYDTLSNLGIVVVDVTNASNRTTLVVDEAARRYGFDVRVRYTRADARTDETVGSVTTHEEKE